jgi:hypothetical protein
MFLSAFGRKDRGSGSRRSETGSVQSSSLTRHFSISRFMRLINSEYLVPEQYKEFKDEVCKVSKSNS